MIQDLRYDVRLLGKSPRLTAILALTLATLAACWIPARRALRVDPMVALRYE